MAQRGMEGRIDAIVRWLERSERSYRSGAMESALMDAECARADLEDLRLDIWARVGAGHVPRRRRSPASFALCLSIALLLFGTAVPLSRGDDAPVVTTVEPPALEPIESAPEFVAPSPPRGDAIDASPVAPATAPKRPVKAKPARPSAVADVPAVAPPRARERAVAHDKVFSLLQTGARALRDDGPAIKIEKKRRGEDDL